MRIGIAVFSGTGNTAHVAGLLADRLTGLGAAVTMHRISSGSIAGINEGERPFVPGNYDLIGIGHPVLGFGATPLVLRFAEMLPDGKGRVFIFKSAADNHRVNNTASEKLISILEAKGYDVFHDFLYVMPCNWVVGYERRFSLQIMDRVKGKAERHAREIMAGVRSFLPVYPWWRGVARFFHYLESNYGRKQFGKALRATNRCTGCGLCVKSCPMGNICEIGRSVRFGENCIWCMHCVYTCPANVIEAPGMNWCILKGGYRLADFIGAGDGERVFIARESKGYWKHFREYFYDDLGK